MNSGLQSKIQDWWEQLNWEDKYQIYCDTDNEVELTDNEKADIVGDREAHRRMVEGEIE